MKCKNCGKKLKNDEYICPDCGTYIAAEDWEEETIVRIEEEPKKEKKEKVKKGKKIKEKEFRIKDSSGTGKNDFYYENEDLLEAYIGEDYKLIKKSPFNFWAFLFNWVYLLYRKLYITGIIGLVISWVVIVFYRKYIWIYLGVTALILGLSFSKYYIFLSKGKVERIKKNMEENNDPEDYDKFTLINICREKGGVNVVRALVIYLFFLLVTFFCLVPITVNVDHNPKFWEENSENLANCTSIVKVAYENIKSETDLGTVEEAVCKITKLAIKEYEIYIKTSTSEQILYSYYKTEDGSLILQNRTDKLSELQKKKLAGTITLEDEKLLTDLEMIETDYQKILTQSNKEEELIKNHKNEQERLYYSFAREEIIR